MEKMFRKEAYYAVSAIILGVLLITIAPRLLAPTEPLAYKLAEDRLIKNGVAATSTLLPSLTVTILSVFSPALAAAIIAHEVEKLKRRSAKKNNIAYLT